VGSKRSSVEAALGYLRALMEGRRLSVRDLLTSGEATSDSSARRHLSLLETIPGVERLKGRPTEWVFHWPTDLASKPFEVFTLRLARRMLVFLRGSALDEALEHLISEKQARLPPGETVNDVSRIFFAKTRLLSPAGVAPDTVDRVVQAIHESKRVEATYESFEGYTREITLEPYSLVFGASGLYCYGRCVASTKEDHVDRRRIYNLARFRSFRATSECFSYPERDEYDPETEFDGCFGIFLPSEADRAAGPQDVVLSFAPRWGHYLRTQPWHPSQSEPEQLKNGRFQIKLRVFLTPDLTQWLRGLGGDVTIIKPRRLRQQVDEAR